MVKVRKRMLEMSPTVEKVIFGECFGCCDVLKGYDIDSIIQSDPDLLKYLFIPAPALY